MIPVLYDPLDIGDGSLPQHLGKGLLTKTTECTVTMDANYTFDMTLQIPLLSQNGLLPQIYDIVKADCGMDNPQFFEIQSVDKDTNGRMLNYYAWHISRRMAFEVVEPVQEMSIGPSYFSPSQGLDIIRASMKRVSNFRLHCEFTYANMGTNRLFFSSLKPASLLSVLTDYAEVLDARLEFDNYDVYIRPKIDYYNGVRITSRRNLIELADEIDGTELISGYAPYWTTKTNGMEVITEYGEYLISGSKLPYQRIVPYDLRAKFSGYPDDYSVDLVIIDLMVKQIMSEIGTEYIRGMNLNYHEIKGHEIHLYDTVDIYCPEISINESRTVVKVTYNVLRGRNEGIQIGTLQSTLPELISASSSSREIGIKRSIG